jgi:2-octaprenyl-6-methoxyphenol hydroxylase
MDAGVVYRYDVVIVGGGLVGLSMALALKPLSLKVAVINNFAFDPVDPSDTQISQSNYDDRCIALSYGSRLIYQGMGIWSQLAEKAMAIKHIHVSNQHYFAATRLHAEKEHIPALGYVIESRILGQLLYQALSESDIDIIAPAKVTQLHSTKESSTLTINERGQQRELQARLLIAADGTESFIRQQLSIPCQNIDYQQTAIIANVSTSQPHHHWAYERFTPNGPLALLPLSPQQGKERLSLVWTHPSTHVDATMALSDTAFLSALQKQFGYRLGHFTKVGKRSCFPLHLIKSNQDVMQNVVLIGNASHTLHPVAGQGLNLSLRDIAELAESLRKDLKTPTDIKQALQYYQQQRQADYADVSTYTHRLIQIFSNDFPPLAHLRSLGLLAVDRIPPLRRVLAQQSMGLKYRQSRLARGLSLQ